MRSFRKHVEASRPLSIIYAKLVRHTNMTLQESRKRKDENIFLNEKNKEKFKGNRWDEALKVRRILLMEEN